MGITHATRPKPAQPAVETAIPNPAHGSVLMWCGYRRTCAARRALGRGFVGGGCESGGMWSDNEYAEWLLTSQRGVLCRAQVLSLGVTAHGLAWRIRQGGSWQRLLPGVYLTVTGEPTQAQREVAALLYAGQPSIITGPAALLKHKIRCPASAAVDVLVPARRERASRDFVVMHRTRRMPQSWTVDQALRYALPARAVVDTAAALTGLADARAVVASAVQQRRCTVDQIAAELRERHRPGHGLLHTVLAEIAGGTMSAAEGDLRDLIASSGLPVPFYNPTLFLDGKFLARPDAWWPQAAVAVEVDSMEFHLLPEDWEQTMRRHRRMSAAGLSVLHVSPRQLRTESRQVLADIAAALRAGRPAPRVTTRRLAA